MGAGLIIPNIGDPAADHKPEFIPRTLAANFSGLGIAGCAANSFPIRLDSSRAKRLKTRF